MFNAAALWRNNHKLQWLSSALPWSPNRAPAGHPPATGDFISGYWRNTARLWRHSDGIVLWTDAGDQRDKLASTVAYSVNLADRRRSSPSHNSVQFGYISHGASELWAIMRVRCLAVILTTIVLCVVTLYAPVHSALIVNYEVREPSSAPLSTFHFPLPLSLLFPVLLSPQSIHQSRFFCSGLRNLNHCEVH